MVIGNTAKAGVRFFAFDQFKDLLKDSEGKTTGARSVLGNFGNLPLYLGIGSS
jgi:solute carrier family 25 citrate transporter 1